MPEPSAKKTTARSSADTARHQEGSPAAKAAAVQAAAAATAGIRLAAAREGRDRHALAVAHQTVTVERQTQLAAKRPESRRVAEAWQNVLAMEADVVRMREEERRAADAGGKGLLRAAQLQQQRAEAVQKIAQLKEERMAMLMEDEARLADAERQQRALEKLELEYVELKRTEQYAEAYEVSVALASLRQRLAALWQELTGGLLSEALMGMGVSLSDEAEMEAGMQPTIPAPFSFADHAEVLRDAITKSQRKIKDLEKVGRRKQGAPTIVAPTFVLEAERSKLVALKTRLGERYAAKTKRTAALRPSPCAFGISASRFDESLNASALLEDVKAGAKAAAAHAGRKGSQRRRTKRSRRQRRRRRPAPPSHGTGAKTVVRLGASSLSPFGFASATPTYRGAASKGVPWGTKEIDRPSLIRLDSTDPASRNVVGQPAPRSLQLQQYAALLLDNEFRPGERPAAVFAGESRPAMGVLFKETTKRKGVRQWNPTTGSTRAPEPAPEPEPEAEPEPEPPAEAAKSDGDGTVTAKQPAQPAEPAKPARRAKPLPSWAWAGGTQKARSERWETRQTAPSEEEIRTNRKSNVRGNFDARSVTWVVDELFQPHSATGMGSSGAGRSARRAEEEDDGVWRPQPLMQDSTLLGRCGAGVVGVRRRLGAVRRGGGLPPVPYYAYTLLREPPEAAPDSDKPSDAAGSSGKGKPEALGARTMLLPPPEQPEPKSKPAPASADVVEDDTSVVWHVAPFELMAYSQQFALPSTAELGFSEMSFMPPRHDFPNFARCPRDEESDEVLQLRPQAEIVDSVLQRHFDPSRGKRQFDDDAKTMLVAEVNEKLAEEGWPRVSDRELVGPGGRVVQDEIALDARYSVRKLDDWVRSAINSAREDPDVADSMSMTVAQKFYRYTGGDSGTMLRGVWGAGPLGESALAAGIIELRSALRSAAFDAAAGGDVMRLFENRFQRKAHEVLSFWELVHVVRKTAKLSDEDLSDAMMAQIFTLVRDTRDYAAPEWLLLAGPQYEHLAWRRAACRNADALADSERGPPDEHSLHTWEQNAAAGATLPFLRRAGLPLPENEKADPASIDAYLGDRPAVSAAVQKFLTATDEPFYARTPQRNVNYGGEGAGQQLWWRGDDEGWSEENQPTGPEGGELVEDSQAADDSLLAAALLGHPGGPSTSPMEDSMLKITPRQLAIFLRTWCWRTLAFDLGWRIHMRSQEQEDGDALEQPAVMSP